MGVLKGASRTSVEFLRKSIPLNLTTSNQSTALGFGAFHLSAPSIHY
jgi:hypothetical protein